MGGRGPERALRTRCVPPRSPGSAPVAQQNAEINCDVPPSCFEPPADVKSLIEKQKAKDSAPASAPATKDAPEGGK